MAEIRWTEEAYKNLDQAIAFSEANYSEAWVENLKSTVRQIQEKIEKNKLLPRRKGRAKGIEEIDFITLPFFLVVRVNSEGEFEFIALLHKNQKYP